MRLNEPEVFLHLLAKRVSSNICVCLLLIVLCILFMNNSIYVVAE